ncbi:MAG TPA: tetratricopeptide repeat protein [Gemmataceae bacterium]|nr:tetratricopeptide repeat protein [Gemmataceae bacterium]
MSATPTFRVFLSAVTGELASYRQEVARVLRRKGLEVREQEHFSQGPATLLERLRDYIDQCDAVILLVGERCGAFPTDEHAAALGVIPVLEKYRSATHQPRASYTQWELFLAKHYGKKTYVFLTDPAHGFVPDAPNPEGADLRACQQAYRTWVKQTGEHRDALTTAAKLVEDVLVLPFPELSRPKPIVLPYPSMGTLFKGRDAFLAHLRACLARAVEGRATAIVGKALHGLGGVGKTRLAVEYAWQHQDDYSALLFVPAETPQDLRRNLTALTGPLVLDLPENAVPEEEVRLAAALRWLREHPGWFLIVDNVDTPEAAAAAEEMLARLHGGQVLLTTRLTEWSGCVEPLELDVLKAGDAAAFFLERTQRRRRQLPTDDADAAELARELDGLALALEQAGAFVAQRRVSLAEYLRDWLAHAPAVQEWHDARLMKYPRSVAVTWQTTMQHLGLVEMALLRLLAWFAPEPVPLFVLEGDKAETLWREALALLGQESPALVAASGAIRDALAMLANYSMVGWDAEGQTVTVHRVVQEILRTRLPVATQQAWLTLSLRLLDIARPGHPTDVRTWPRWNALRPHVALAAARGDALGIAEPTARLMNELGLLLAEKALHGEAEPLMRRALAIDERSLGDDHPNLPTDLNNVACLLQATNRLAEAEPLYRRALAIDERRLGPDHPNLAVWLNNLAGLLQLTNRLAEAEPLYRRALGIDERGFGRDHPKVAIRLNNLAQLLQATNRLAEAEPLMRRAVGINERSFGPEHPHVATDLNNLALLLQATSRLAEAEPLLCRAVDILEKSLGADHPNVATTLNNLAGLLQATSRLAQAEPLYRRALAIDERSFGPEHSNVARDLNNLAGLLQATNRLAEAEPLLRRALALNERSFGSDHPNAARDLNNLAHLLGATNRLAEAELLMSRALAIDERSFGPEHPTVATDLNNLAQLLKATDRLAEAEPLSRRMLGIFLDFTRRTAHEHPDLQAALANHRGILKRLGRSEADIRAELEKLMAERP